MSYTKQKPVSSLLKDCGGYNLIMTAISLVVIGVITVSLLNAYMVYDKHQKVSKNQEIISNAINKIQVFKETYGRFPCPSSLNAARNTVAYGREDCSTAVTVGTCSGGLCVTTGRTIPPSATAEPIRTGAIPFRLLQIDEKMTYDAYGSRLVYSMTQNMSSPATFNEINGAIGLADETGQSLTEPASSADFVIISQGPNRVGAYNAQGDQVSACTGTLEGKNCIDMASAPAAPTTFISSLAYLSGGTADFDDTIEYFSSNETARWRRADGNLDDIQTVSQANVGVGINDPTVSLDIGQNNYAGASSGKSDVWDGGLRVTTKPSTSAAGKVEADTICSKDGTECFKPENFATTGMTPCPANKYMVGIRGTGTDAEPICSSVRVYCPSPTVLTGIVQTGASAGQPICSAVSTNCLEKDVQVCNSGYGAIIPKSSNEVVTNPTKTRYKWSTAMVDDGSGVHNTVYQIFDQGSYSLNKAWSRFTCVNGEWIKYTGGAMVQTGGLCSCNPSLPPSNIDCTVTPSPSPSCTGGTTCAGAGTGTAVITYNFNATACLWQQSGAASYASCTCSATPTSAMPALGTCPAGTNTGNSPSTWTWNPSPAVCDWRGSGNTCACDPALATPPAAFNGQIRKSTTPADTQACNTFPGRGGELGNAYRTYKFNGTVGACRWDPDGWDFSDCTCTTGTTSEDGATTCNLACQNEVTRAKDWFIYTMPGCVKTLDHTDPSTCSPKNFDWQIDPTSPPLTNQPSHGSTKVGDACNQSCMTANVQGSSTTCWLEDTVGFKIYTCICKPSN